MRIIIPNIDPILVSCLLSFLLSLPGNAGGFCFFSFLPLDQAFLLFFLFPSSNWTKKSFFSFFSGEAHVPGSGCNSGVAFLA